MECIGKLLGLHKDNEHLFLVFFTGDLEYLIYKLSPNLPSKFPDPVLRFETNAYPSGMGFFSLGTKIYFIGGEWNEPRKFSTVSYICDTVAPVLSVMKGQSLNGPKICPFVLHLKEKVYVISPKLSPDSESDPPPHIEVFDPFLDSWEVLPEPSFRVDEPSFRVGFRKRRFTYEIQAHAVFGTTILLLTGLGLYAFDVESPKSGWNHVMKLTDDNDRMPFIGGDFAIGGLWLGFSRTMVNVLCLYELVEPFTEWKTFQLLCFPSSEFGMYGQRLLVDMDEGLLCVIECGFNRCPYEGGRRHFKLTVIDIGQLFLDMTLSPIATWEGKKLHDAAWQDIVKLDDIQYSCSLLTYMMKQGYRHDFIGYVCFCS